MDDQKRILTDCVSAALTGLLAGSQRRSFESVGREAQTIAKSAVDVGRAVSERILAETAGPQAGKKTSSHDDHSVRIDGTFIDFPPDYVIKQAGRAAKGDMILTRNPVLRWQNVENVATGVGLSVNLLASVITPTERDLG
tara:strand:- start:39 stop:458 length:420 start_codon:yes stop_codon:yes gene_type:complete